MILNPDALPRWLDRAASPDATQLLVAEMQSDYRDHIDDEAALLADLTSWLDVVRAVLDTDGSSPAEDALPLLETVLEVFGQSNLRDVAARVYEATVSKALLLDQLDRQNEVETLYDDLAARRATWYEQATQGCCCFVAFG